MVIQKVLPVGEAVAQADEVLDGILIDLALRRGEFRLLAGKRMEKEFVVCKDAYRNRNNKARDDERCDKKEIRTRTCRAPCRLDRLSGDE